MERKHTRRRFNGLALSAAIAHSVIPFELRGLSGPGIDAAGDKFVHPGMLHTEADLERMRDAVRVHHEPIFSGFEILRQHPNSQSTYAPRGPAAIIGRNPTVHVDLFDSDANAAYQCALMWCITGDQAFAKLSIRILNAWASTLEEITGADAVLCASLGGFKLLNAAELIRHTGAGWSPPDVQSAAVFFQRVLLPAIHNFAPFANGNWDTAAIKCMMAIGIFCDDIDLIDRSLQYYLHGCGDGQLENYIYPGGQCEESGRDQQHTQLGLAHMGDTCEMAWNQGLDLYGAARNRLLDGFEYTARYNLGLDVRFAPDHDRTGKYTHETISSRSALRPIYEQIYNHYAHRRKLATPYTQRAAEKLRPEGPANGADHTGFGTLLYSHSAKHYAAVPNRVALGALHAIGSDTEVQLTWVPSNHRTTYAIRRSPAEHGDYNTIATDIAEPHFTDRKVIANQSYFYRVAPAGVKVTSWQIGTIAGLPPNWSERSYGNAFPVGRTNVIADTFSVQAYGTIPFGYSDELHFVHSILNGDGVLTACISPLLASQAATVGIMLRTEDAANAPMTALSISVSSTGERPQWNASLLLRDDTGGAARTIGILPLNMPIVAFGRLAQPFWLRLARNLDEVHAQLSRDGVSWTDAGKVLVTKKTVLAGCFACSGLGSIPAQVTFEQLILRVGPPS